MKPLYQLMLYLWRVIGFVGSPLNVCIYIMNVYEDGYCSLIFILSGTHWMPWTPYHSAFSLLSSQIGITSLKLL